MAAHALAKIVSLFRDSTTRNDLCFWKVEFNYVEKHYVFQLAACGIRQEGGKGFFAKYVILSS